MARNKPQARRPGDLFPDDVRPDYPGIGAAGIEFLRDLKRNNERAWFREHRELYEREVRFPLECLVAELSDPAHGLPVRGDPRRAVFRVHRDIRFSRDKSPYKTHAAAYLTRDGVKGAPGGLYIHVEPGKCFLGAGFFMPDSALLLRWRQRMVAEPGRFLALVEGYAAEEALRFATHQELKTLPRGFKEHADAAVAPYLRWKDFLVSRDVADAEVATREFVATAAAFARRSLPLLEFGWEL